MPRACVIGQSPNQGGWSEDFSPLGLSLRQCGHVFANSVRYTYIYNFREVQVSRVIIVLLLQNCFVLYKDHTHHAILTTELLKLKSWQLYTKI